MNIKIGGVPISSPFGNIDAVHKSPHTGVDIPLEIGTPLKAVGDGIVSRITDYHGQNIGKGVILQLEDGKTAIYGHMSQVDVHPGQVIHKGDILGLSGNTGHSTGPHLHLGLLDHGQYVNPEHLAAAAVAKPGFFEKLNPFDDIAKGINEIHQSIDSIVYWVNPAHWLGPIGAFLQSPDTAYILLGGTIIGGWLIMLGANWPKKYVFWSWVTYWALRVFLFG